MEAKLKRLGEVSVIEINGSLQIERTQAFRDICMKHLSGKKLIFNMERACFVGSTGIQPFIDTMRLLVNNGQNSLKLVCLKPEFLRIFSNLELRGLEIYEDEHSALRSFEQPHLYPQLNKLPEIEKEETMTTGASPVTFDSNQN